MTERKWSELYKEKKELPTFKMGRIRETDTWYLKNKGEPLLDLTFRLDQLSLHVSTRQFSLMDAFAKFAGLERVLHLFFIMLSLAFI